MSIENRLAKLEAVVAKLKPLTWIKEPTWYCSGYKNCCKYKINYITKVKPGRIKVKCIHVDQWILYDDDSEVEEWIAQGYEKLKMMEDGEF